MKGSRLLPLYLLPLTTFIQELSLELSSATNKQYHVKSENEAATAKSWDDSVGVDNLLGLQCCLETKAENRVLVRRTYRVEVSSHASFPQHISLVFVYFVFLLLYFLLHFFSVFLPHKQCPDLDRLGWFAPVGKALRVRLHQ